MEQETKNKSKRAIAIAGIATLSAFALIGLFAIGALIGGCAEKKQADAPASEQVHTAQARRLAVADEEPTLNFDGVRNYMDGAVSYPHVTLDFSEAGAPSSNVRVVHADNPYYPLLSLNFSNLPAGLYYFVVEPYASDGSSIWWGYGSDFFVDLLEHYEFESGASYVESDSTTYSSADWRDLTGPRLLWPINTANLPFNHLIVRGVSGLRPYLVMANALDVPPVASFTLPEDWNPTAWVSDEAIGGYPVVHGSYTTEANASGAYVRVGWANVVFKTASDSAVFTSLEVRYRWLWTGQKYRINGEVLTYTYSSANALLYPVSVSYLNPVTGGWSVGAKEAMDIVGGDYVHTGQLNWLYPTYRTLGFLEYPENPTTPNIRFWHTGEAGSGEATWQLTPTLQGLDFFDWFGLASWNSPQQVDVGTGNAIGLISTAFTGMVPILGISIFPNITLGLLLFLPLIGGIIVLIIKAVSK